MTDDRHLVPQRSIRPTPPDLWFRLGDLVGARERSATISKLIAWYLDGGPPPTHPDDVPSRGKPGRVTER